MVPPGLYVPTADGRVVMRDIGWSGYQTVLALRGDRSSPRLAYLDGAVEIMSPSHGHETTSVHLSRVLEYYCLELGIRISNHGSWTLSKLDREAGAEPDQCFIFGAGRDRSERSWPDLVIEVNWTRGGINKLEIYKRLGIPEVWFWQQDTLRVFALTDAGYEQRNVSQWVPDLDLEWLLELARLDELNDILAAVRTKLGG